MQVIRILILFFIVVSSVYPQLLRPTYYRPCNDNPSIYEKLNLTFVINEKSKNELLVKIKNPYHMGLDTIYFTQPNNALTMSLLNDSTIVMQPLNPKIELKEKNNLIIKGKVAQTCVDTIMNVSVLYNAQLYKKWRYLSRVELGFVNNGVTFSDKSILTNERYKVENNSGYLLGCELIEYRSPSELLYLGLSLGVNGYWSNIKSIKSDSVVSMISSSDILFNFRGDLPFYFLNKNEKDLSLRFYLSFPFLCSSSLSSSMNDKSNLKLYYGFGLNYNLTKWCALEIKSALVNSESFNSALISGSKINYNTLKSELIFSFINVYDNLYELISD